MTFTVWWTLIAQFLLTVIQKQAQTQKVFSVVVSLVRVRLFSVLDVYKLLRSSRRYYANPSYALETGTIEAKFIEGRVYSTIQLLITLNKKTHEKY